MSRTSEQRSAMTRRITLAARVALSTGGGVTENLIADICDQVGVHPHAFRLLFPTDDDLLDAVNELLVEECAERLRGGVATFTPTGDAPFVAAATALAESWPLDRSGMVIRADRRLRALRAAEGSGVVAAAERRFVAVLASVLVAMLEKIDRSFSWSPTLAVRLILDTYERSFEAWLLEGHSEADFAGSPYVQRTLPTLLERLSE